MSRRSLGDVFERPAAARIAVGFAAEVASTRTPVDEIREAEARELLELGRAAELEDTFALRRKHVAAFLEFLCHEATSVQQVYKNLGAVLLSTYPEKLRRFGIKSGADLARAESGFMMKSRTRASVSERIKRKVEGTLQRAEMGGFHGLGTRSTGHREACAAAALGNRNRRNAARKMRARVGERAEDGGGNQKAN